MKIKAMHAELHIITSNKLEILTDAIATLIASPNQLRQQDPLDPEMVLVQSKGMQQWLSMAIAERNGICANIDFPFPNAFLVHLYEQVVDKLPHRQPFDAEVLTFRILSLLPDLIHTEAFASIRNYLADSSTSRKRYQLASKIADVFDQYQIFRPEMLLKWEAGQYDKACAANAWQPILWQSLCQGDQHHHRAAQQKRLIAKLNQKKTALNLLPARIAVFGISHLPPFHLQVLGALSLRIPVYMFLLNPCRHYWGDILSDRQFTRTAYRKKLPDFDPGKDLHIDQGNRLLASWGGQGKQFLNLVHQMDGQMLDLFDDNQPQTMLSGIQQDILDLNDRTTDDTDINLLQGDRSIQIHSCHSPMREVEVFHDQLIGLFENNPKLAPHDILVMTPNIGDYTPYIHAVFNNPLSTESGIPYTVADQGMPKESRMVEGFLQLLALHKSRFQLSQVMALLNYSHIRKKFKLEEGDLSKLESWLNHTHIRWGWDGAHRKKHALPGFEQNTWRHGLDRLILGYAMQVDGAKTFNDILPQQGIDATEGELIGALSEFAERLYRQLGNLPDQAQTQFWHRTLLRLLDDFFVVDESGARERQALRDVIDDLLAITTAASFSGKVPFEVVQDHLKGALDRSTFGTGFMAGSVTFCAMLPMRSIPAKVICVLGMGYDTFPQDIREPAFNLIAGEPAFGDRSKRDDDKYLFLEALLSAREVFYLSYVGRSIQDNASIPPSVVVDELLEYIESGFGIQATDLVTQHPLQPFSKRYFDGETPGLFSYSKENLMASRAMDGSDQLHAFFPSPLESPETDWRHCTVEQLCSFFTNPARFLLERRLNIHLHQDQSLLEDHEHFNLDALERFKIKQSLLETCLKGAGNGNEYAALCAAGTLPHGTVGRVLFQQMTHEVQHFVHHLGERTPEDPKSELTIDLHVGPFHLSGELGNIYPEKRLAYRLAKMRPQDRLTLFISHLIMLTHFGKDADDRTSMLICQDGQLELAPINNAHDVLLNYLELYWQGLHYPLQFFAKSSYEYALKHHQGKTSHQAMAASRTKWYGSPPYAPGEHQDPYLKLCFGHQNPLDGRFMELALNVFLPIINATHTT